MTKFLAAVLLALASCGGSSIPDTLTSDEQATFDRGGSASNAGQQFTGVADSLFDFDPTLDVQKSPEENALAVAAQARLNAGSCGTATVSGASVTVTFAQGCTLATGLTLSGSVTVAVAKSGATLTVTVSFANFTANGAAMSGSVALTTSNGSTFTTAGSITSGATTYALNLTLSGATGQVTLDGTMSVMGDTTKSETFTKVVWKKKDCYPSAGTLQITEGRVTSTVTFLSTTPADGKVTVQTGRKSVTTALPAYGQCPPAKDAGH